jgi:hypothetical protein
MRDLLLLILLGVAAYLGYDNYSKRGALKAAQEEIQRLNTEHSQTPDVIQAPRHRIPATSYAPAAPSQPAWFRERLNQRPSLDEPVRHRHGNDDSSRSTSYNSPTPAP